MAAGAVNSTAARELKLDSNKSQHSSTQGDQSVTQHTRVTQKKKKILLHRTTSRDVKEGDNSWSHPTCQAAMCHAQGEIGHGIKEFWRAISHAA
jgi:hypothetical protein